MLSAMILAAALAAQESTPPPDAMESAPPPAVTATDVPSASASAAIDAGLKAFKRRRYAAAEAEFLRAIEAEPQSAAAHFYLGYTYYKRGEPALRMNENKERAKEHFARAFELDPQFRPVWGGRR